MVRLLKNYQNYEYSIKLLERHRILMTQPMDSRTDQHQEHKIEILSEPLRSLKITEENISERTTEYIDNILIVLVVYNEIAQAIMPKSITLDPEWRQMFQNILQEEFYPKSKKENGDLLHFCQE